MQRLKDEQENFECKIQQLEQQNLIIAQERESILFKITELVIYKTRPPLLAMEDEVINCNCHTVILMKLFDVYFFGSFYKNALMQ